MRTRTLLVLILALASGGIAGYAALQLLNKPVPVQAAEPRSSVQVVVAVRDLPVGRVLGAEDVKIVNWPGDAVPEGYARTVPDVIGRGIITSVRMNEPLLEGKMADRSGRGGMPILIPEGLRALSVRVDEVIGVAGFIDKGVRVDVLLTMNPPNEGSSDQVTRIVLQNIEVLARGQQIEHDPEGRPLSVTVVTMLVTPEEAEQLTLATTGRIQLALRNMIDVKEARTTGARMSRLIQALPASSPGGSSRARAPAPTAQDTRPTLELFKGGTRALIRF